MRHLGQLLEGKIRKKDAETTQNFDRNNSPNIIDFKKGCIWEINELDLVIFVR